MKRNYRKKDKFEFYFDLSVLSEQSLEIYTKSVTQFINNTSNTLQNSQLNLYTQLGLVALNSQFAERLIFQYAFLYDEFCKQEQSEIISNMQDLIMDVECRLKAFSEANNTYSQFRDALIRFDELIPLDDNFRHLTHRSIDDRNYLIHHCVIDNPTLLNDREKIVDLTKKAIYCCALLYQIVYGIDRYFTEAITTNYREISIKWNELKQTVNELYNKN